MLILDNAGGHIRSETVNECKEHNAQLVFTPARCTDMCAVTDAGLGRSLKNIMKKKFRNHFTENYEEWCSGNVSSEDRRRLTTKWFAEAIEEFRVSGREQIIKAHQRCGSGLRFNGSEDHMIRVDGYDEAIVL